MPFSKPWHSKLWADCDKLYIEFNALQQTLAQKNFSKPQVTSAWLWQYLICLAQNLMPFRKPWHNKLQQTTANFSLVVTQLEFFMPLSKPCHRKLQQARANFSLFWRAITFEPEGLGRSCLQFQKAKTFALIMLAFELMLQDTNICTDVIWTSVILHQRHFALVTLHHLTLV
jgi:hypothetical protein